MDKAVLQYAFVKASCWFTKVDFSLGRLSSNIGFPSLQWKVSLLIHMRLRVSFGLHSYSILPKLFPHWQ